MTTATKAAHRVSSDDCTITVVGLIKVRHSPSPTATTHDLAESVLQTLWNNDQHVWRYVIESVPDTEELVFLNVDVSDNSGTGDSWSVRDSINQQIRSLTGDGWRVESCQGEPS